MGLRRLRPRDHYTHKVDSDGKNATEAIGAMLSPKKHEVDGKSEGIVDPYLES